MSSRITYANAAAVLVDWIAEQGGDAAAVDFIAAWMSAPKRSEDEGEFHNNSILALCEQYNLNWGLLAAWIRKDTDRDNRFKQALLDRGMWRKERLLDSWWKTADSEPEDRATHGDVHKAREAIAKAEGVFSDKLNVQHSGEVQVDIRRFTPAPNDKPAE